MRDDIVAAARSWLGTPYRHQMSLKGEGCDCIGLIRGVWREMIEPEPWKMPPYSPIGPRPAGATFCLTAWHAISIRCRPGRPSPAMCLFFR